MLFKTRQGRRDDGHRSLPHTSNERTDEHRESDNQREFSCHLACGICRLTRIGNRIVDPPLSLVLADPVLVRQDEASMQKDCSRVSVLEKKIEPREPIGINSSIRILITTETRSAVVTERGRGNVWTRNGRSAPPPDWSRHRSTDARVSAFQSERLSKQRYAWKMCVCPGRQHLPAAALILEKAIPGTYGGTTTGTVSEPWRSRSGPPSSEATAPSRSGSTRSSSPTRYARLADHKDCVPVLLTMALSNRHRDDPDRVWGWPHKNTTFSANYLGADDLRRVPGSGPSYDLCMTSKRSSPWSRPWQQ